ncbi:hypothetical protein Btheta7330_02016 [Bacteroides thetaiotaomicron]|nr:hypothetical protein Btheta7330_02016 [Bacteroides thetaiotaomicron]
MAGIGIKQNPDEIASAGLYFLTSSLKKPQYYNWLINNIL